MTFFDRNKISSFLEIIIQGKTISLHGHKFSDGCYDGFIHVQIAQSHWKRVKEHQEGFYGTCKKLPLRSLTVGLWLMAQWNLMVHFHFNQLLFLYLEQYPGVIDNFLISGDDLWSTFFREQLFLRWSQIWVYSIGSWVGLIFKGDRVIKCIETIIHLPREGN